MATITEIRLAGKRVFNLGNYESQTVEASVLLTVEEGDDIEAVKTRAQAELRSLMATAYKAQNKGAEQP